MNVKTILQTTLVLFCLVTNGNIWAQTGKDIAQKVYNRPVPKDGESDMTMTLINKKGNERVRSLHKFFIDLGEVEKQIMFFKSPSDVKNTSFMNWSYESPEKEDDQWLYLPALKKVKRISNSSKDKAFMGSDFTYEDMEKRNPNRDEHLLMDTAIVNGEVCWIVKATPKATEQYSKKVAWISKSRLIPIKIEYYDEDEILLKTLSILDVKKMSNYWIITKQEMVNHQKNHKTQIHISNITIDKGLTEGQFSQRQMQRGL